MASASRKTGATGHLMGVDSYFIDVASGVDAAFITLVVMALDDMYHD